MFSNKSKLQIIRTIEKVGFFSYSRRWNATKLRALLYHRFSDRRRDGYVSQETFRKQVAYAKKAFRILCPDTLFRVASKGDHGVVITVDDGYRDFYDVAFPILRETRAPAIVYLTTDFIDGKTWLWFDKVDYLMQKTDDKDFPFPLIDVREQFRCEDASRILERLKRVGTQERDEQIATLSEYLGIGVPENPPEDYLPLSWEQIREMAESGIAFGSHTCTHPILTQSEAETAWSEIRHSKERIEEELGKPVISFAYPNGAYNESVVQMVREAGYEYSFACNYGFFNPQDDRYTLNRVAISDYPLVYFRQDLCGVNIFKQRIRKLLGKRQAPKG
jgi:peptidoglycan/xylan/chitin deacetylase (PgdA/CDA1 family)